MQWSKGGEYQYSGTVAGSNGEKYDVTIDTEHPRKSHCSCPHAAVRQIVCKHIAALYFTASLVKAVKYIAELEAY